MPVSPQSNYYELAKRLTLEELKLFLRPPGSGLWVDSTGGQYATRLQKVLYETGERAEIEAKWQADLARIPEAHTLIIGLPCDTGASIMRGANFGPIGIREAYLSRYDYPPGVIDVGDVLVVPQLLHEEMLSQQQIIDTRMVLYQNEAAPYPVSALSMLELSMQVLLNLNPKAKVILLGGDHGSSWPAMLYAQARCLDQFGILHFDAHTDLMQRRLGVKYCFATWAYHTLRLIRPNAIVQVGLRASTKTRDHWEHKHPVKQIWMYEVQGKEDLIIDSTVAHFKKLGLKSIYISNDIDGTDSRLAPATGTPEEGGLQPEFVIAMIERFKREFTIIGGDIVEVAPPLSGERDFSEESTCITAAHYLNALL